MGSNVALFEERLSNFFGREAVCVSTGTSALQLALQACDIGVGHEVIVPSLTYVASFQAIAATGAVPVAAEVREDSLTLDPDDVEGRITGRTRAIMPVHYGGGIAALPEIYALARTHGLRVIEDAAHSFGGSSNGDRFGSVGDISCFSFDPIKNITAGDGGAVVSGDPEVLQRVRDIRLLGVKGDSEARKKERRLYEFDVVEQGWRYHMNNINAAIGLTQLGQLESISAHRRFIAHTYNRAFEMSPHVLRLPWNYDEIVPHIYVIRLPSIDKRNQVRVSLKEVLGVETALHWYPNHLLTRFRNDSTSFSVTEKSFETMVTIPLHSGVTEENALEIAAHINASVAQ